jgi:hypothetical protein
MKNVPHFTSRIVGLIQLTNNYNEQKTPPRPHPIDE